jgi:hypothetical protein
LHSPLITVGPKKVSTESQYRIRIKEAGLAISRSLAPITSGQLRRIMSGLRPWDTGDVGSDDGDVVSHDSAGEIEDTSLALEILRGTGPPRVKVGMPDKLVEGVARPEEIAEIVIKTERIRGDTGSFYGFIAEVSGGLIKKAIDGITGFVTLVEFRTLVTRVSVLENFREEAPKTARDEAIRRIRDLEAENKLLRSEMDKLSLDFAEFSAGAREIYNTFQSSRTVEADPKLTELMSQLAEANRQRDEALKRGVSTGESSGGIAAVAQGQTSITTRRSNPSPAVTAQDLRTRFTPNLSRQEAARRFAAGER